MVLNMGGEEDDENHNQKNGQQQQQQRPAPAADPHQNQRRLQRMVSMKRQDSWSGFKDKAFRVASTVILPKPMRTCSRESETCGMKTKSMSVKSLPQLKHDDDAKSRRKLFLRSISAPQPPHSISLTPTTPDESKRFAVDIMPAVCVEAAVAPPHPFPAPTMSTPPAHMRRVLFAPRTSAICEEPKEEDEACLYSPSSSRSPSEENLEEVHGERRKKSKYAGLALNLAGFDEESPPFLRSSEIKPFIMEGPSKIVPSSTIFGQGEDEPLQKFSGKTFADLKVEEYYSEVDEESLSYEDYYNCMPPPIFMLIITLVEIGFFIYHTKKLLNNPHYGYINKYGPAPLDSALIYNPTKRHEIWRYLTYAFVHSGYMHIINNIAILLVLGILLEIVHKWQRVLCIYVAGILAGSLATSITEPFNYLAGASAGVYALIAAHLSTVILNWKHMEYPWVRVLIFVAFLIHDGGTAIYFSYIVGEKTNVGYSAHLGGAVAGLLVGIHVLKNLEWSEWEIILWYTSIVICFCLLSFAIVWNIVRTDLFP